jgi:hypothetical protein
MFQLQLFFCSNVKHLGITRTTNGKVNLEERLKTGRQTIYALLLGSGLFDNIEHCLYVCPFTQ